MTLDEYLKAKDLTASEFAAKIGRSISTVTRIRRGDQKPDWDTAGLIWQATCGEVAPNDYLEISGAPSEAA